MHAGILKMFIENVRYEKAVHVFQNSLCRNALIIIIIIVKFKWQSDRFWRDKEMLLQLLACSPNVHISEGQSLLEL